MSVRCSGKVFYCNPFKRITFPLPIFLNESESLFFICENNHLDNIFKLFPNKIYNFSYVPSVGRITFIPEYISLSSLINE